METLNRYYEWLVDQSQLDQDGEGGYSRLCEALFRTTFESKSVFADANRVEEAWQLRNEWADSVADSEDVREELFSEFERTNGYGWYCSYLELLIVMARKIAYETLGGPYEASIGKWMREMMANCGMDEMTDGYFKKYGGEAYDKLEGVTRRITMRAYSWDGDGGIFPLMYPLRDQRRIELLDQMNDYLAENYDIC